MTWDRTGLVLVGAVASAALFVATFKALMSCLFA
jgi:hypothetical protein